MPRFALLFILPLVGLSPLLTHRALAIEPEEVPDLIRMIETSQDNARRNAAIKQIMELKKRAASAIPDILRLTKSTDPTTRLVGVGMLESIGPKSKVTIPELRPLLKDSDLHVRYWTCKALGAIGPDAVDVVPDLIGLVEKDVASVRRHAALAIGKIGPTAGPQVLPPLIKCLDDQSAQVRADACDALGRLGELSKSAVPRIEAALEDKNFHAYPTAAVAHWRITGQTKLAIKHLVAELKTLDSPDDAVKAFGEMGAAAKDAVPELEKFLADNNNAELQTYAAESLGNIGPAAAHAVPSLEKLAVDDQPDEDLRDTARAAIEKIKK